MYRLSFVIVFIVISFKMNCLFAQEWVIQTVDSSAGDCGWTSIALSSNDYAHISYSSTDIGGYHNLRYARWTGMDWVIEEVDTVHDTGYFTSIALDNDDYPHISYGAMWADPWLMYARWTGAEWSVELVDTFSGFATSIKLDINGYPHITSVHIWNTMLKHFYWTGSNWIHEDVDSADIWTPTSLILDNSDYPHIAYLSSHLDLMYGRWTGSNWQIQQLDTAYCATVSLALDNNDYPHISYSAMGNLRYTYWSGTDWVIEEVDTFGAVGAYTSIAIDDSSSIHVSYYDVNNKDLKYAQKTGTDWMIEKVDTVGDVGGWTSLTLDNDNKPHISYCNVSPHRHLKYAYYRDTGLDELYPTSTEIVRISYANPSRKCVIINYQLSEDSEISLKIYNVTGKIIKEIKHLKNSPVKKIVWNGKNDSGQQVPEGVYFIQFQTPDYKKTKKVILLK